MNQNRLVLIIAILSLAVIGLVVEVAILIGRSEPSQTISNQPPKEAFPNYPEYRDETLISEAKDALGSLRTALEVYAADTGYYCPGGTSINSINYLAPNYVDSIDKLTSSWAKDPAPTYNISGSSYTITVRAKDQNLTQLILTPMGIRPQ